MNLNLNREEVAGEIQKNFTELYPYLKIEFYKSAYRPQLKYPSNVCMQQKDKWVLKICDNMTVSDLENSIRDNFGLMARVYRRLGNMWLKTSITENLTLRQQNDHGREITQKINAQEKNPQ